MRQTTLTLATLVLVIAAAAAVTPSALAGPDPLMQGGSGGPDHLRDGGLAVIPEPATIAMLVFGAAVTALRRRSTRQ
jgi:hypothetical protein